MPRRDQYNVVEVTPTVTASSAYTAQDQVGGIMTITDACPQDSQTAKLVSVTVVDQAKQGVELVVFFFDELPTVASTDHNALNVADDELSGKCIGFVTIPAASYQAVNAGTVGTVLESSCGLVCNSKESGGNIYAVAKTTGTPTFAATDDLTFKFAFKYG